MRDPGPSYSWFASDAIGSSTIQKMTLEEEACYRRLLDFQWMDGIIPQNLQEIRKLLKNISIRRCEAIWAVIGRNFELVPDGSGYVNPRLNHMRNERIAYIEERAISGKKGGKKSWKIRSSASSSASSSACEQVEAKVKPPIPIPIPFPNGEGKHSPSPEDIHNYGNDSPPIVSPSPKIGSGPRDRMADAFAASHLEHTGTPYPAKRGDFVQLAALRKASGISKVEIIDGWEHAIANYFASPLGAWTLADLAARFPTFKNSPLDRYGKPTNHANGGHHGPDKHARNLANAKRVLDALDNADGRSDEYGDFRSDTIRLLAVPSGDKP